MTEESHPKRLKKELSFFSVFAIALGTTLSAGFFLLPGLAFEQAGPAVLPSYLLAWPLIIPALPSLVPLSRVILASPLRTHLHAHHLDILLSAYSFVIAAIHSGSSEFSRSSNMKSNIEWYASTSCFTCTARSSCNSLSLGLLMLVT